MADTIPCLSSTVSPNQPAASAVPGNIGIVRAKVLIWDNDPLFGRPHQRTEYPFSENTRQQLDDKTKTAPNAEFEAGAVFLKPRYDVHNLWLATVKWTGEEGEPTEVNTPSGTVTQRGSRIYELDFLDPNGSQKEHYPNSDPNSAYSRNGEVADANGKKDPTTGRDIFDHQI